MYIVTQYVQTLNNAVIAWLYNTVYKHTSLICDDHNILQCFASCSM